MSTATLKDQAPKDEAAILAIFESAHKALHNKDAAAIAAQYSRDAAVYSLAPPLSHTGMDSQELKAWFDTWEGPIDRESRDFSITINGDFAFCHGFLRLSGTPKAAGRPISFWMRATVCRRAVQLSSIRELIITVSASGESAFVHSEDSGPGVSCPELLFQPFDPGADGAGLGLYISRALVRSYGGDLRLEKSNPSCFVVQLQVAG